MKGNSKVLDKLNQALRDELTAVNQYFVHAEMCENWRYERLADFIKKQSIDEMKHAEKLIERMLFLEGTPTVNKLSDIHIGADVPKQFDNDLDAEMGAVKSYNAAIKLAQEVGDNATKEILDSILKDEDDHVDEIETQQDQIKQMGLPQYLSNQAS